MNKRQKKKKQKKYLPVIADEFNLMTMTEEEREKAFKKYEQFRERFAYRKRYKDLKSGKPLRYYFPTGESYSNLIKEINQKARSSRISTVTVTQNLSDFGNAQSNQTSENKTK